MADAKTAISITLQHEGGFVDNPNDPGGATNMGITQRDMPGQNIRELTVDQAVEYYSEHYWKPLYSQINSQSIANKLFDLGVLFGIGTAVGVLQTAMNITHDGVFGPGTLDAVNQADVTKLLQDFKNAMTDRALNVVKMNPKEQIFLKGWLTRINS